MFKKFVLSCAAVTCLATAAFAQQPCSTDEHYRQLLQEHPELALYREQFEAQLQREIAARTTAAPDTTTYDVPLVVHVIHDYGLENLSDDDLYTAAKYWAVVYLNATGDSSAIIPPFKPYIGNPNIRLHLATIDPTGKPTKGIVRVQSYLANVATDQAKYNQWPPHDYVNIWLVGTFGAQDLGVAAYAYLPGAIPNAAYDGVISLYTYTSPSTKTIPHELGHVLNLLHPWGNTNNPEVACGDDNVEDTPPTKGHYASGCELYDTACATGYVGTDGVNYPDTTNTQNIMDYSYCTQEIFTKGQAARMRAALTSSTSGRNNLYSPANLAATGALLPMPDLKPIADYIMNKATGGGTITDNRSYFLTFNNTANFVFRNESWNDTVSSVAWTFSNGATLPVSTSATTVTNKFSVPGWVTVSLIANSNAGSDTLVNTQAVYAADTTAAGGIGYSQSFGSAAAISNWPMFNYYNNQFKWEFYNGAGLGDNACVRYRSFDTSTRITGNATGDHDDFVTPAFNLANAGTADNLYFNFYTAAAATTLAHHATPTGDSLEIDVSTTGGARWTKIAGFNGAALTSLNGNYATEFVPTNATQWQARAVNVPAADRTNNTFFRFRYWPGNAGNDLYLDNFNIYPFPAGVKDIAAAESTFSVFPNPATNGCNILFKTGDDGKVSYSIKDITGKVVYEAQKTFAANSLQQEAIPRSVTPAAGMYFVTLVNNGIATTQKLVVY